MVKAAVPDLNKRTSTIIKKKIRNNHSRRMEIADPAVWSRAPADVVDRILSSLPVREAARSAVVSRRFSEAWRWSRRLRFDRRLLRRAGALAEAVDRVLGAHRGEEIEELSLRLDPSRVAAGEAPGRMVERWVGAAAEKGLRELRLDFGGCGFRLNLAGETLRVGTLERLSLSNCAVPPAGVGAGGFQRLRRLVLRRVELRGGTAGRVLGHCQVLESLEVVRCGGFGAVRVESPRLRTVRIAGCSGAFVLHAPSLRTLHYSGSFWKLRLVSRTAAPVNDAVFDFEPIRGCHHGLPAAMLRRCLSKLSLLTLTSTFLEDLAPKLIRGTPSKVFTVELPKLKEFQLYMESPSFCNLFDIACFLVKCPALEKLIIDFSDFSFEVGQFWESHLLPGMRGFDNKCFDKLVFVKLKGFKFEKHEIYIVKFLLKKSPALKKLALIHPRDYGRETDLDPHDIDKLVCLFGTWKQSPSAKIRVLDYDNDNTYNPKQSKTWYYIN